MTPTPQETLDRLAAALPGAGQQQGQLPEVLTRVADFLQLEPQTAARGETLPLEFLLDVTLPVQAELGHTVLSLGKVLELQPGSVVELDREVSQPVDLTVCGALFARGEVVVVDDRFAIRIKELFNPRAGKGGR